MSKIHSVLIAILFHRYVHHMDITINCFSQVLHMVWCYISGEAAAGNLELITHGSERVKRFITCPCGPTVQF